MAIGAFSSLPFISAMAHNDNSGKIGPWATLAIDVAVPVITALKVSSFARFFLGRIAASAITKVMKLIFPKDIVFNAADILLNEIQLTIAGPVWLSDTIVPLDSQLALTYTGIRRDVKYFSMFRNAKSPTIRIISGKSDVGQIKNARQSHVLIYSKMI